VVRVAAAAAFEVKSVEPFGCWPEIIIKLLRERGGGGQIINVKWDGKERE
jgi:hypothetical protein